jgi:uncharacterized protein
LSDNHLPFWKAKRMQELNSQEWEALCDGCARCCLIKLEDEETREIFLTWVTCPILDIEACRCTRYSTRHIANPECIELTLEVIPQLSWLPDTCAYRLLAEGKELPDWHPLISGSDQAMHNAGMSIRGKCISEKDIPTDSLEDYIVE